MRHSMRDAADVDQEARVAEYVCGLLGPEDHAQIHQLLSRDDAALGQALAWEERLLALVDALPRAHPDPALRERLQRTLGIGPPPAFQPPPQLQLLRKRSVEPGPPPASYTPDRPDSRVPVASASVSPASPVAGAASAAEAASAPHPATAVPVPAPASTSAAEPAPMPSQPAMPPVEPPPEQSGQSARFRHSRPSEPPGSSDRRRRGERFPHPRQSEHFAEPRPSERPAPARSPERPATPAPGAGISASEASSRRPPAAPAGPGTAAQPGRPASRNGEKDPHRHMVRKLWLWRLISLCAASAAVAGFMLPGEPPPPPVQVIKVAPTRAAILQAPGSTSTPGWTATLDPHGNLMMRPLVHTEVPAGSQAMLWTRSPAIPEPRPLGRIDPNRPVQVPAAQLGALAQDQLLEITLERDEDAAQAVANGPILFIGQMTVFGSEASPDDASAAGKASAGPVTQQRSQP